MDLKDVVKQHNKICWYPSAGADFRALLFLSKQYLEWKDVPMDSVELPDLFIYTDCKPTDYNWTGYSGRSFISDLNEPPFRYKKMSALYRDSKTEIFLNKPIEELQCQKFSFDERYFGFDVSKNYGKAFLMNVHIQSKQLGEWDAEVVYVLSENTTFAFDFFIREQITVDYILRVRFGDAFGGSSMDGSWMLKLLKPLHTKYFLSTYVGLRDFEYVPRELVDGMKRYEDIVKNTDLFPLQSIYKVNGSTWSNQGDIYWYKVMDE